MTSHSVTYTYFPLNFFLVFTTWRKKKVLLFFSAPCSLCLCVCLTDWYLSFPLSDVTPGCVCFAVFLLLLFCSFGISSLVIGILNPHKDMPCMKKDSIGLYLDEWMIGKGVADIGGFCFLAILFALQLRYKDNSDIQPIAAIWGFCLVIFNIIWWVFGVIILARSSGTCLSQGTDPGIMTLIVLILCGF